MKNHSLRLRLLVLSGLTIIVVLCLIGVGLLWLFQSQLLARTHTDLGHQLNQLAAIFTQDENGNAVVEDGMTDPRYELPLSGLYWQVNRNGNAILRSRSLWDMRLRNLTGIDTFPDKVIRIPGPGKSDLISLSRVVTLHANKNGTASKSVYRLLVAVDIAGMEHSRNELFKSLSIILALSGLALIAGTWVQIRFGLRPLDDVRQDLEIVRQGGRELLDTSSFPAEVQPLAHEINDLLEAQQDAVERARRRSVDLAHGLKTPIAAIAAQIDRMEGSGRQQTKKSIGSHLESMRRHVEAELARVRAQGGQPRRSQVTRIASEAESVIDILKKLPNGEHLNWSVQVDPAFRTAMDEEDIAEVLGNLLDNARKWARSEITVAAQPADQGICVQIEDDGKGIDAPDMENAVERGTRLDENVSGTGLGLSIAQAILETYGSRLEMQRAALGGLQVSFEIPSATKPQGSD